MGTFVVRTCSSHAVNDNRHAGSDGDDGADFHDQYRVAQGGSLVMEVEDRAARLTMAWDADSLAHRSNLLTRM